MGLLTPGEQLYIVHGDTIIDGDLEAGQRLIAYDAPVGELVTALRDAMLEPVTLARARISFWCRGCRG